MAGTSTVPATSYVSRTSASAVLHIDVSAIVANYRLIGQQVAPAQAAAVVKADCYGLGAATICPALERAGCRHFFVAHLAEAQALRPLLSADSALYILNGLVPGAEEECAAAGTNGTGAAIIPVLNSPDQIDRWAAVASALTVGTSGRPLPAVLQIDSGMSRLGLQPHEIEDLLARPEPISGVDLRFIMSHFACADTPDAPSNQAQNDYFYRVAARFPALARSLDNSSGSFLPHHQHGDIVRPGIALYGGAVQVGQKTPMYAVARLTAKILQLRTIKSGTGVGYGLTYAAPEAETIIATIGVGYADGWPRALSNKGSAFINGIRVPIAGRVSMDSMTLDVTHVPAEHLHPGAPVELIGPHQSIDDVANDADTISYEILTQLSHRYWRVYEGAEEAGA
ncbi:MAG: alanine racemase [Sphingobium sp.]|nr:alanine racemase [Sphingobium sp.]